MISINRRAFQVVQRMLADSEALGLNIHRFKNGALLIDAGVEAVGSLEAGLLFAEACMGGLGKAQLTRLSYQDAGGELFWLPGVGVSVSLPHIACMASQYAGWSLRVGGFSAMGSGPAGALYREKELHQALAYTDQSDIAVLLLEGSSLPDEETAAYAAGKCGIAASGMTLITAPAASLVGSVQIAARVVETALHKMDALGFDVRKVSAALGFTPLAPVAADELHAMGRANDAILYGGQVFCTVDAPDDEVEALAGKIPSLTSRDYGAPFLEVFQRYGGDFYQIDPLLFSPAEILLSSAVSGKVFCAGRVNSALLRASLLAG